MNDNETAPTPDVDQTDIEAVTPDVVTDQDTSLIDDTPTNQDVLESPINPKLETSTTSNDITGQSTAPQSIVINHKTEKAKKSKSNKHPKNPKESKKHSTSQAIVIQEPKKRSVGKAVLIGIVLMLISAAATWYVMTFVINQPNENPVDSTQAVTTPADQPSITAQEVVEQIQADLNDNLGEEYTDLSTISSSDNSDSQPVLSPAFKPNGSDFFVTTLTASGLEVNSKNAATNKDATVTNKFIDSVESQVIATLTDNGFEKADSSANAKNYQSDSVVCSVSSNFALPIMISCADLSTFDEPATALKPFAEAYNASTNPDKIRSPIFMAPPLIKDSSDGQHQTAEVAISSQDNDASGKGMFWRTSTGDWNYLTTTQSILSCDAFNTPHLKAAFNGEQCLPGENETPVLVSTLQV